MVRTYSGLITELKPKEIFVFGSNTQGRHGRGAAKIALEKFGAIYGKAFGLQGQSYAIVTKDLTSKRHPSIHQDAIIDQINDLYEFAAAFPEITFYIAYSGVGSLLCGYTQVEMAGMWLIDADKPPANIVFNQAFYNLVDPMWDYDD